MYIQVWQVQRLYLSGKPPVAAKIVEQPGEHRHEGSTDQLRPRILQFLGSEQLCQYPTTIAFN